MPTADSLHASTSRVGSVSLDSPVPIEAVIITSELARRPARARDLASEHLAVTALMEELSSAAGDDYTDRILQRLAETALAQCQASSAGMSMLEMEGANEVFRSRAIAGQWAHLAGGTVDRQRSGCGVAVDANAPVLLAQPHRHFGVLPGFAPVAEVLLIPFHFEDRPVGTLWVTAQDADGRRFDAEDVRLLVSLARCASIAYRLLVHDHVTQVRLEAELADSRLLHAISAELITENDEKGFSERLLDAAMSIMHSDCASLQMFKEGAKGGYLDLIAHRGFSQEAIDRWQSVDTATQTTCGEVLRSGRRVIATDVTKCDFMSGSEDQAFYLRGGILAVQSTPLLSRSGRLLGRLLDPLADDAFSQRARLAAPRHARPPGGGPLRAHACRRAPPRE